MTRAGVRRERPRPVSLKHDLCRIRIARDIERRYDRPPSPISIYKYAIAAPSSRTVTPHARTRHGNAAAQRTAPAEQAAGPRRDQLPSLVAVLHGCALYVAMALHGVA